MSQTDKINLPNDLNWEILKRFNTIIKSSSFTKAAKQLNASNSSLLNQMDNLEAAIGKPLFVRQAQNRTLELTPEGKKLKEITNKISHIVTDQMNDLVSDYSHPKKTIRIITTPGLATTLLPKPISSFKDDHDDLKIKLDTTPVPPRVKIGEVLIRNDFLPQENLKAVKIFTFQSCFYASKNYIDKYKAFDFINDIVNHKFFSIQYYNFSSMDKYTFEQSKYMYVEPDIESDYISFLIEMALLNQGILELPSFHPATKELFHIKTLPSTTISIYAAFLDIANQDDLIYTFTEYLQKFLNDEFNIS